MITVIPIRLSLRSEVCSCKLRSLQRRTSPSLQLQTSAKFAANFGSLQYHTLGARDSDLFGYILHRRFRSPQLVRFSQKWDLRASTDGSRGLGRVHYNHKLSPEAIQIWRSASCASSDAVKSMILDPARNYTFSVGKNTYNECLGITDAANFGVHDEPQWGSWWTPMGFMMNPKVIFWGSKRSVLDDSRISTPKVHILMHIKTCFVSMRKWAQKLSKS